MIARHRGEHDNHWGRWRPVTEREQAAPFSRGRGVRARMGLSPPRATGLTGGRRRAVSALIVLTIVAAAYVAVGSGFSRVAVRSSQAALPATPRAWLDAYEAAAVDNPAQVCSQLFSPQLARAYGRAVHGSCRGYFRRITSFSVVVRRVLQDDQTAVLELRQTVRPRDWAVVLSRRASGWQAVDLLSGALLR
jgi:hypothetical protein